VALSITRVVAGVVVGVFAALGWVAVLVAGIVLVSGR
jgi:hypothetical protein